MPNVTTVTRTTAFLRFLAPDRLGTDDMGNDLKSEPWDNRTVIQHPGIPPWKLA